MARVVILAVVLSLQVARETQHMEMFNMPCVWPWLAVPGSCLCPGQGCSPDGSYESRESNLASRQ